MAKDKIDRAELAGKLLESATSAEDPAALVPASARFSQ
jgi:hypothetical protein